MFEVVDEWASANVKALKTQIQKRNIGATHKLLASLAYNIVRASDGNVSKAQIMFNYYGRFVDMGVGRGVKIGDVKEVRSVHARALNALNARRPKKWYSKPMAAGVNSLSELLAHHFGRQAVHTIESQISNAKIELTI